MEEHENFGQPDGVLSHELENFAKCWKEEGIYRESFVGADDTPHPAPTNNFPFFCEIFTISILRYVEHKKYQNQIAVYISNKSVETTMCTNVTLLSYTTQD